MKKCSEKLRKRSVKITNDLYNETVSEVFDIDRRDENDINSAVYMLRLYNRMGRVDEEIKDLEDFIKKRDMVEILYQRKIIALPTKDLKDILDAHNRPEGITRAAKTIENIVGELARRSIFGDSSQSDFTYMDGEIHEHSEKIPERNKKARCQRDNALKRRLRNGHD